jgi:hypothetical protein
MISSQRPWPLDHEAGQNLNTKIPKLSLWLNTTYNYFNYALTYCAVSKCLYWQFFNWDMLWIQASGTPCSDYERISCTQYSIFIQSWWHKWLRHCATSQKVMCSISDGVTGIFHSLNPSSCTMTLGSTLRLRERSTKISPQDKCGQYIGLTTFPLLCIDCLELVGVSTSLGP